MYASVKQTMDKFPPDYGGELLPMIRKQFLKTEKTIVVLDDDPTGTQTCHDVAVLTSWSVGLLVDELKKKPSILFILTNSRSLTETEAVKRTLEITAHLTEAVKESGRAIVPISRSDSTLRGHFPAEVEATARGLMMEESVWILVPAFIEGRRFTLDDVHYVVEQEELVPVSDTPFAKDSVFGYRHSNVKEWVEEKTNGQVKASEVLSLSLAELRTGGPEVVAYQLEKCDPGTICLVNACSFKDIEVFVMGMILAEKSGKTFLSRTSATFVPIRAGISPGKTFSPKRESVAATNGSLVVVGSYVPKTTSQLEYLLTQGNHQSIEVNVTELLTSKDTSGISERIIKQTEFWLAAGKDVVIHTSRELAIGKDSESSLRIHGIISEFLVSILRGLTVRPSFIVAKGGITSSDLASQGLSANKALVLGQAIPGVPVWQMDTNSKFPEIKFVVFPGNVGDITALYDVCKIFTNPT